VTSEDLDKKVRKCANYLGDTRILTKLAIYDMRTLNASYHNLCLSKLYKRSEVKKERVLTDSAFHSVVDYIKSKALFKYKLSDLTMLYLEKIELGNPDLPVPKPNATIFKEKLLLAVPGLVDINFGKEVLFMFEKELSLAPIHSLSYHQ